MADTDVLTAEMTMIDAQSILDQLLGEDGLRKHPTALTPRERMAVSLVVMQRRIQGDTLEMVSNSLGISMTTVHRYEKRAFGALIPLASDEARNKMIAQCEGLLTAFSPRAASGDEKAAAVVLKTMERLAKLQGTDTPVKVEATVVEESAAERELRELLDQSERDNRVRAAALGASDSIPAIGA